jgi:hypothetical protein
LPRFVEEVGHFGSTNRAAVDEGLKPVFGFLDLLEAIADLGDKLGLGPTPGGFSIICTDGKYKKAGQRSVLSGFYPLSFILFPFGPQAPPLGAFE